MAHWRAVQRPPCSQVNSDVIQFVGWVPAFIFPLAASLQLFKIFHEKSSDGVSAPAWAAFGLANMCLYVYTEKYGSWQTIIGMLGQAAIDFSIAGAALYQRYRPAGQED